MAANIKFDLNHNPEQPTLILVKKSGERLGLLRVTDVKISQSMTDAPELSCTMNKYLDGELNNLWDEVRDFRLIWWKEENLLFEIVTQIDEALETVKSIDGTGLAQAELSQINVYDTHINNEDDPNWNEEGVDKNDTSTYVSVLYRPLNSKLSILKRLLEKAPHYTIKHVDYYIADMPNRTLSFDFDSISILDAFNQIAEEVGCLFILKAEYDESTGDLKRNIYVYDLMDRCAFCGERTDNLSGVCPNCGKTFMLKGYGDDTTIFVTADELGEKIGYSCDTGSVKNCFKLEAGDDYMTATVRNCNPNGSDYIWRLSDIMREDMSNSLRSNLTSYENLYKRYQTTEQIILLTGFVNRYNDVVSRYSEYNEDLKPIPVTTVEFHKTYNVTSPRSNFAFNPDGYTYQSGDNFRVYVNNVIVDFDNILISIIDQNLSFTIVGGVSGEGNPDVVDIYVTRNTSPIIGYPALMETYYNVLDCGAYLEYTMMPTIEQVTKTARQQVDLLTSANMSPIGVNVELSSINVESANSNVLDMAKAICDSTRFKITINSSSYNTNTHTWTGTFKAVNYSDDTDTAISENNVNVQFSDDYLNYIQTKIDKVMNKSNPKDFSITGLYNKDTSLADFKESIKSYGVAHLKEIYDCGQKALDILVEQGVANRETHGVGESSPYTQIYEPYLAKVQAVNDELGNRTSDLITVIGKYSDDGNIETSGMKQVIEFEKNQIQDRLNLEKYIGSRLWKELCSFRRDDKYSNSNYISEGLNNAQMFERALEFLKVANNELYKSSELQHSITSTLRNLLYSEKFEPLLDHFEIGNWLRIKVDDEIYKLRLVEYDIDFDDFDKISVKFSDVTKVKDGITDVQDILDSASSMATSYSGVKRQAEKGNEVNKVVDTWFEDGLKATNTKIIGGADNQSQVWDEHGMLFRRYDSVTDSYDSTQMKIINSTLAITSDNWDTVKTAVGYFYYVDPADGITKSAYGINGEVVIGKMILGQNLGIYNGDNSLKFNENGMFVSNGTNQVLINPSDIQLFKIQKNTAATGDPVWSNVVWMDNDGNAHFNGEIIATSGKIGEFTLSNGTLSNTLGNYTVTFRNVQTGHPDYGVFFITDSSSGSNVFPFRINGNGSTAWVNDKTQVIIDPTNQKCFRIIKNSGTTASPSWSDVVWTDANGNAYFTGNIQAGSIDANTTITGSTITGASGEFTKSFKVSAPGTGNYTTHMNEIIISGNIFKITKSFPAASAGSPTITEGIEMFNSSGDIASMRISAGIIELNGDIELSTGSRFSGELYLTTNNVNNFKLLHTGDEIAELEEFVSGTHVINPNSFYVFEFYNIGGSTHPFAGIQSVEINGTGSESCVVGEFHTANGGIDGKVRVNNLSSSATGDITVKIKVLRLSTKVLTVS